MTVAIETILIAGVTLLSAISGLVLGGLLLTAMKLFLSGNSN
jgi:hypothetical protein